MERKKERNNVKKPHVISLCKGVEANFTCLLLLNTQKRHLLRYFSFFLKNTAMPYFEETLLYAPPKFCSYKTFIGDALIAITRLIRPQ